MFLGTQVDTQSVSLLPGESHTFTVTGNEKDLVAISNNVEAILWSHNRVVNPS
jgi:hypothetical protein